MKKRENEEEERKGEEEEEENLFRLTGQGRGIFSPSRIKTKSHICHEFHLTSASLAPPIRFSRDDVEDDCVNQSSRSFWSSHSGL